MIKSGRTNTFGRFGFLSGCKDGYYKCASAVSPALKRGIDVVLALTGLALLVPAFLIISTAISTDGGPVLYRHRRVGRGASKFDCLKFRTMISGADRCLPEYLSYHPAANTEWNTARKLSNDPRVTTIGRILRKSSLDEIPQLINVLLGHMSLVGPRPITEGELQLYGDHREAYHAVRPGITGLWQVSGRNELSFAQRMAMDAAYVRGWSLLLDLKILARTPQAVISRKGAH